MSSHMVLHVSICAETLATALRAEVWPLILMNPDMHLQILPLVEGFLTVRVGADVSAFVVSVHVRVQMRLALKAFATPDVGASKLDLLTH